MIYNDLFELFLCKRDFSVIQLTLNRFYLASTIKNIFQKYNDTDKSHSSSKKTVKRFDLI